MLPAVTLDHLGVADDQRELGTRAVVVQDHPLGLKPQGVTRKHGPLDVGQLERKGLIGLHTSSAPRRHGNDRAGLPCRDRERAPSSIEIDTLLG